MPGIKVVARRDTTLETLTNGEGEFQFQVINPGNWTLKVESAGFLHDSEHDFPRGPLVVPVNGCQYRYLSVVADGHIRGRVRDNQGAPVADVPVQVFNFDERRQEFETLKFAESKTGPDGVYDIGGLPAQDYIVGINAEKYHDSIAYAPTYFGGAREREEAQRVTLKEGEHKSDVDITIPPKRTPVKLIVYLEYEDGSPVTATGLPNTKEEVEAFGSRPTSTAHVTVTDLNDVQRAVVPAKPIAINGAIELQLWKDEVYKVTAWRMGDSQLLDAPGGGDRFSFEEWEGSAGIIHLVEAETHLRLVLYRKIRDLK